MDWDLIGRGTDLLGGIGGSLGAYFGGQAAQDDRDSAEATLRTIRGLYGEINPYVSAGHEDTYNLGPSAMEGVASEVDPVGRSNQLAALRSLMDTANQGGMDAQSRAALMQSQAQAAREQRATQGALRNDFAARGRAGGGAELALRAAAQQQSANANAMAGAQSAASADARRLAALQSGASLAGQVRGQDYGQATDRAQARDRVAEYNTRNRQAVQGRNIDRRYASDQQTFDNRMRRAGGEAGALQGLADYRMSEAERRQRQGYAAGGAIGSGVGAVGGGLLGGW